jgi:hypothetical protein
MAKIGAYRFGLPRRLTSLAHRQVQSRCHPAPSRWIWAGSALHLPSPGRSGPRLIFFRKRTVILFVLQTLKFHRICFVHANELI